MIVCCIYSMVATLSAAFKATDKTSCEYYEHKGMDGKKKKKTVARWTDNQRSPEIWKIYKNRFRVRERERGQTEMEQNNGIAPALQINSSPTSHRSNNYACMPPWEIDCYKEKKHHLWNPPYYKAAAFVSTGVQVSRCYICVTEMKRGALFISRGEASRLARGDPSKRGGLKRHRVPVSLKYTVLWVAGKLIQVREARKYLVSLTSRKGCLVCRSCSG